MKSQKELNKDKDIEIRLRILEEYSHRPVQWEEKINRLRQELDSLYERLNRYGL